uniref:Uncharacterized protein n=1 Tax=Panagrolaimus sp. PS1159 TaxID=55785 RepID=A0AC35G1N5_9BILA
MAGKSLKRSPDGTSKKKSPDKNGNIISGEKNEKAKPSPEKASKEEKKNVDGGDGGGDEKGKGKDESGEDSFPLHKPIVRDVDRAEEIKNLGYVDRKRDDYKTIRNDLPESDFDKSLGLPAINDDKKK